jgi:hypothetical protein
MNELIARFVSILLIISSIHANPIQEKFFSEIQFADSNSTEWIIELQDDWGFFYEDGLNGWYLVSSSDTAYFNPGLRAGEDGFILIRADSLQSSFSLSQSGDIITLFDSTDQWMDEVRYGDVEYSEISYPMPNQSICLFRDDEYYSPYWYIDTSPTLGIENDFEGGVGTVEGYAYNFESVPLEGVRVIYGFGYHPTGDVDTLDRLTDSLGHYIFYRFARLNRISTRLNGFVDQDSMIQVWPDSVRQINFYLRSTVGIKLNPRSQIPRQFALKQNYPNPFNPFTKIEFDLHMESNVTLQILRIDGSELVKLMDQKLKAGNYSYSWDSSDTPSGIYLYSLKAGGFNRTKKMILLK